MVNEWAVRILLECILVDIILQVMFKKQNRHSSMSVYLATLAVTESISLASGRGLLTSTHVILKLKVKYYHF